MMASTMALTALSIDLMLPAFDEMRADFGLAADSTDTAATVTVFFIGLAIAQLIYGPLADRFGRKPVLYGGLLIFVFGAIGSALAGSLGGLLVYRFVWGVGSAAPRVISLSVIRDIYEGDRMARVMSFVAAVFILVPVVAPSIGALLLRFSSWRFLFWLTAALAGVVGVWLLRLPETLDPAHRLERLQVRSIARAARMVVTNRQAVGYTVAMTFVFGAFVSYLASSELVWEEVYGRGDQFPLIFGALALVIGIAMLVNGVMVDRIGARRIVHGALFAYVATAGLAMAVAVGGGGNPNFWIFVVLLGLPLVSHGLLIPNANSLAMAPLGSVAGTASAIIGAVSIMGGAILGAVIDRAFDGTVTPMITGFFLASLAALLTIFVTERGRLFGDT
jgi:DHA1 family bicyclomycin/chloramphenicol resistance-like MFS transporter